MTSVSVLAPGGSINVTTIAELARTGYVVHVFHNDPKETCTQWANTFARTFRASADIKWVGWHLIGNICVIVFIDQRVVVSAKTSGNEIDILTRKQCRFKTNVPSKTIASRLKKAARLKDFESSWVEL